jgi:GWxTD domain-containing protein
MKVLTSFSLLRFNLFIQVLAFLALVPLPRSSATQNRQKEPKKPAAQERQDYYKKWLREDVVYITTDDERKVFQALTTPEERDAFIEQFWSRRDPDPRTGNNEFKEEHYRRIAYANENFFSGKDGWATDRGRIYITFGPPTHIEDNSGGVYRRRPEEGGGYTSTYSFQRWFYNEIPGVGRGIELEFVDATKTGEYRLALRPSEKDALWNVGGGLTWEEAMANPDSGQKVDRAGVMLSDLAGRNIGGQNEPMYMRGAQSFERVRQYFNVSKPPQIKFNDLKAKVEATVTFNQIPIKLKLGNYRVGPDAWLVPLTIEIPADELSFKTAVQTVQQSLVNIYGRVEKVTGDVVYEFEDQVAAYGQDGKGFAPGTHFLYQKQLPLKQGRYKATVVVGEDVSKRISTAVTAVQVGAPQVGSLTTSSVILADGLTSSMTSETLSDPFVTPSGLKVFPNMSGEFRPGSTLNLYVEAYEVAIDQAKQQPILNVRQTLLHEGRPVKAEEPKMLQLRDRVVILNTLDLKGLPGGSYQILLQLHDQVSGQNLTRRAPFKIVAN